MDDRTQALTFHERVFHRERADVQGERGGEDAREAGDVSDGHAVGGAA